MESPLTPLMPLELCDTHCKRKAFLQPVLCRTLFSSHALRLGSSLIPRREGPALIILR